MKRRLHRPGRLVVRLAPGLELEPISAHRDVRLGAAPPAIALDRGGKLDRAVRAEGTSMLVTRAFCARRSLALPGRRHESFDDTEHALGLSRTFRVTIDPHAPLDRVVARLRALEHVEMAAPQFLSRPDPTASREADARELESEDAARRMVGAEEALELEPGDSALIVGLVDSGVDLQHPELQGRLRPGMSSVTIVRGLRARAQDVDDEAGHGTFCAGIISANGFRVPRGLAGAARLLPIRALCSAELEGEKGRSVVGSIEDINSGWKTAIDLGARVLNLSFGTSERLLGPDDPIPHMELVRYALAHDCVLIAASGNSADQERYFPAALPGVIAVGSVGPDARPSKYMSRGAHVAICAPGERLISAGLDGRYAVSSGTSFAAPLAASACALLLARAARNSLPLAPSGVRSLLVSSARAFPAGSDATGCGAGVLDAPAALRRLDAAIGELEREEAA